MYPWIMWEMAADNLGCVDLWLSRNHCFKLLVECILYDSTAHYFLKQNNFKITT